MTSRYEEGKFLRRDLRQLADYFANHSLNRTRRGMPARPGRRYAVHFRRPGLAVIPRRAG
jgi:hypothetical protein